MPRKLRDVDTGDQGQLVRFVGLIVIFGCLPVYMIGRLAFPAVPALLVFLGGIAGLVLLGRVLWRGILGASHGLIGGLSATGGHPYTFQYSDIEALIARGAHAEAAARYREIAATAFTEAEPHIRLGDVLVTYLDDHLGAVGAYQAARAARPTPAEESRITNALIDLHRRKGNHSALKDELLRFARLHPNAPAGRAAREEVRRMVRAEENPPVS